MPSVAKYHHASEYLQLLLSVFWPLVIGESVTGERKIPSAAGRERLELQVAKIGVFFST